MLPSPRGGGGDNDDVVVVVDAPYPNEGEAGMAAAEAMGEDGEGGALVVPATSMMDASTAGKGKGGVVGQDGTNGGCGQAMGLEYGGGSGGGGGLQVGQLSNGSNAPHSIFECGSAAKTLERTEKEGEVTVISPLAFAAIPTAHPLLRGHCSNAPHSISEGISAAEILTHSISEGLSAAKIVTHYISEGISAAKIVTHSISKGVSAAKNLTHSISEGISTAKNLMHSISEGGSNAKNLTHSISKGGSDAEILEMTEKEEKVMIITQVAGKTSGMTDKEMNIPKHPDWPSKKTNDKPPSLSWWPEILDLKKRDLPDQSGMSVLCILCQDGMGKSDGVVSLCRSFNCYYWGAHEQGNKHCNLIKQRCWQEEQITKGNRDKKNQFATFGILSKQWEEEEVIQGNIIISNRGWIRSGHW
jgi:hypothetical protein